MDTPKSLNYRPSVPIAVIGMGCRLPGGADSPNKLWRLLSEGRNAWTDVPSNRWNWDSFHHPDPNVNEAINHRGGHFLQSDPAAWDASFFGVAAGEARTLDPQQRILLETSYEALESAGVPAESVRGSKTSVYVATFSQDWETMLLKDTNDLIKYHVLGTHKAIVANRVSYFFDLKGPSVTVDTACSGGLVALHLACQSLKTGESNMAMVSGTNLILSPELMFGMTFLNMLNDDGKSYSFDERGAGYGRGEGVATLLLKRLDEAIADGDPIRAVIRNTGVNQDGKTNGISYPSQESQQELAESVYAEAGLDPRDTGYVEAHGTGTAAGDKIEMGAIRSVFCRDRDSELLVGTVKANLGHLESTSGLAAVIKAVLALERGVVPGVPGIVEMKASLRDIVKYPIKIPRIAEAWPLRACADGTLVRRVSVQNFGFGGTNAHVILESASTPASTNGINGVEHAEAQVQTKDPRLFAFTAKSKDSLHAGIKETREWVDSHGDDVNLEDLAYTLGSRRSLMIWRSACVAHSAQDLHSSLEKLVGNRASVSRPPPVVFVFNGQGAQWFAMGRELLQIEGPFRASIHKSDEVLKSLGLAWSLLEELQKDKETSRIDESEVAQPASTAIQVALVDLLRAIQMVPQAVVGHSSGEIAAAYAAGGLTHEEVMAISLHRSQISRWCRESLPTSGAMMAVGLGESEVQPYLKRANREQERGLASVACVNSPNSTTITGDREAVEHLHELLDGVSVFNRLLKVDTAYHSHHMKEVAPRYEDALGNIQGSTLSATDVRFFSSVTTEEKSSGFGTSYWVENLVSQVRFSEALENLSRSLSQDASPGTISPLFIEIGPHSALKGPLTQTLQALRLPGFEYQYTSALSRGQDARQSFLSVAGKAFELGCAVDIAAANSFGSAGVARNVLTDLPRYSWDHSTKYWHESRLSKEYRFRKNPYHDLLGLRVVSGNSINPAWRQILSVDRQPWLRDHVVDNFVIFPGSGYICMAIEGILQLAADASAAGSRRDQVSHVKLRNIQFLKALVIPDSPDTVEVQLLFVGGGPDLQAWREFTVVAVSADGRSSEHCRGSIALNSTRGTAINDVEGSREEDIATAARSAWLQATRDSCPDESHHDTIYAELKANGNLYGPTFAAIQTLKLGDRRAVASVQIPDVRSGMPGKYMRPHLIHPTTLDAIAHVLLPLESQARAGKSGSIMPTSIGELSVSLDTPSEPGHRLEVVVESAPAGANKIVVVREGETDTRVDPLVSMSNLRTVLIGEAPGSVDQSDKFKDALHVEWEVDADFLSGPPDGIRTQEQLEEHVAEYLSSYSVKKAGLRVLETGGISGTSLTAAVLAALSTHGRVPTSYEVTGSSPEDVEGLKESLAAKPIKGSEVVAFNTLDIARDPLEQGFGQSNTDSYDAVIIHDVLQNGQSLQKALKNARKLLKAGGALVMAGRADGPERYSPSEWTRMLSECSFSELEPATTIYDADGEHTTGYYCVVSTARVPAAGSTALLPIEIIPDTSGKLGDFASQLSSELENLSSSADNRSVNICAPGVSDGPIDPKSLYVVLDEGTCPILKDLSVSRFANIKGLALKAKFILWVSMRADGLNSASEADMEMATGFTRVIRKENEGLRLVSLVVKQDLSDWSAILQAVIRIVKICFHEERGHERELEYHYRDGRIIVPRLRPAVNYQRWQRGKASSRGDQVLTEIATFYNQERPLKMEIEVPGLLSSLRFTDDEHHEPLGPLEVEIQGKAYGVDTKAVEIAMGHIDQADDASVSEWSGVLTAVGSGLDSKWKVGDRVCGLGGSAFSPYASSSRIQGPDLDLMRRVPSSLSFSEIASSLHPLTTAYHALVNLTRVTAGQSVLIHAADEPTGQAAVMIARLLGAEIFATVRDATGSRFLIDTLDVPESNIYSSQLSNYRLGILRQTAGQGVDVVVSSLGGATFKDSWGCIAQFGTFVHIDEGVGGAIPAGKNAVFTSLDMGRLIRHRPTVVAEAMDKIMELIEQGKIGPIAQAKRMPISEIEDAFRIVSKKQTPEKVVLEINDGALVKATIAKSTELKLPPDATYVVPGGLGSLGEKICVWLAERGAKHIVTLTRSGATRYSDAMAALEADLERLGAKIYNPACDITDEARVREVAEWCAANLPPVRGIIQSAAVFKDKTLENMDIELFNGGLRPKREGTLNIYNAFASDNLDAFILLSSAATVLGSKGQTHYNAGNSFQEGFALQKLAEQPSSGSKTHFTTIQPALITGSDADVTGAHRRKMFTRQGGVMVEFSEVLSLIEYSLGEQARSDGYVQLVLGVDPNVIQNDGTYNIRFMTDILQSKSGEPSADGESGATRSGGAATIAQRFTAAADEGEASRMVEEALANKIRELVAIGQDGLRPDMPLAEVGVDSLVAIEIKNWIGREFEAPLQTSEVLDAPGTAVLAQSVARKSKLAKSNANGGNLVNGAGTNGTGEEAEESDKSSAQILPKHGFACCSTSNELPIMPLLDLDTVLDLFLKAVQHLMTPDDLSHMIKQLNKLKAPSGLGRKLHARLMDRFNDPTIDNWIFEPANEQVYTGRNYPISPWSSFAGTDAFSKFPHSQAERATIVSLSALEFKHKLEAGKLEPTVIGGRPQCMYQHGWLFNAFREPVVGVDKMRKMPSEDYIAVLRRGHLFRVNLVDEFGGAIAFPKLQATFQNIIDKVQDDHSWVGILTADDRNSWAKMRQAALDLHPDNKKYLDMVEGAAFLVCLDDGSPTNTEERMERMLLNDGFNRWFDKGLKLIVCSNGVSGSHMEHSMIDGMTIRELYDARTEAIESYQRPHTNGTLTNGESTGEADVQVEEYTFHTSPAIEDRVAHIRARYLQETSIVGFTTWTCTLFGQDYFQARRLPSKGIYETMVQLASKYYLGKNYPCWSAISMGHYHKGRIDIIQTYTAEMQSFCNVVDEDTVGAREKRALLVDAARSHGPNILRAQHNKGYERTLVALETQLREGEDAPEIYSDPVYQSVRPHWVMTGSTDIGGAGGGEFGFILRHPDSVWLQYLIESDKAMFAIVMRKEKIGALLECLERAARVVKELIEFED
ncbi:related to lovastatin nonaketide synthase [Cephalotrichum gorgonifer]|uniref:Related to lovastatin nonaketide synthase n=1 Tax=Cephalotrichum gorgonifer TaxID=2041049 RepID=A0AAE8N405_9PEZI|nr:related to lovastatin nonaketide synthase [Cephalotrichum gorgonifer]